MHSTARIAVSILLLTSALAASYRDYSEPSAEKRQLYAFPRVGRGDLSLVREESSRAEPLLSVPHRRNDSPGMWFGPRLGRSFKSEDDITIHNDNNEQSEPEQMEAEHTERKKRQIKPL